MYILVVSIEVSGTDTGTISQPAIIGTITVVMVATVVILGIVAITIIIKFYM